MSKRWMIIIPFLILLLSGCGQGLSSGDSGETETTTEPVIPVSIECTAAYRSSVTVGIEQTETLVLSPNKEKDQITFDDLTLHTWYSDGTPYKLRTLKIWVSTSESSEELSSVLYQLSASRKLENQVVEHGFTGLHYVYHPATRSELQFWCSVKE